MLNLDPDKCIDIPLIEVLEDFRKSLSMVECTKAEGEGFLKVPGGGVCFRQAMMGLL